MLQCTLAVTYSNLYFEIESALYMFLTMNNYEIKSKDCNLLNMYKKLEKSLIAANYTEIENGLKCLKYVRNSYHGNMGKYYLLILTKR